MFGGGIYTGEKKSLKIYYKFTAVLRQRSLSLFYKHRIAAIYFEKKICVTAVDDQTRFGKVQLCSNDNREREEGDIVRYAVPRARLIDPSVLVLSSAQRYTVYILPLSLSISLSRVF